MRTRIDDTVQTEKCRCCNKDFKSILKHLNKTKDCQSMYNMEEFDEIRKQKQRERVAKFRLKRSDSEKKLHNVADAKRKAGKRARMTSPEKKVHNLADAKRKAGERARMTSPEKNVHKLTDTKRKAGERARMTTDYS